MCLFSTIRDRNKPKKEKLRDIYKLQYRGPILMGENILCPLLIYSLKIISTSICIDDFLPHISRFRL